MGVGWTVELKLNRKKRKKHSIHLKGIMNNGLSRGCASRRLPI